MPRLASPAAFLISSSIFLGYLWFWTAKGVKRYDFSLDFLSGASNIFIGTIKWAGSRRLEIGSIVLNGIYSSMIFFLNGLKSKVRLSEGLYIILTELNYKYSYKLSIISVNQNVNFVCRPDLWTFFSNDVKVQSGQAPINSNLWSVEEG